MLINKNVNIQLNNDNGGKGRPFTAKFIEDGGELFRILSLYDDYLVDIVKKENYKAGNTLKLILPFFESMSFTSVTCLPPLVATPIDKYPEMIPARIQLASFPYTLATTAIGTDPLL